jgi:hypothetical protein
MEVSLQKYLRESKIRGLEIGMLIDLKTRFYKTRMNEKATLMMNTEHGIMGSIGPDNHLCGWNIDGSFFRFLGRDDHEPHDYDLIEPWEVGVALPMPSNENKRLPS